MTDRLTYLFDDLMAQQTASHHKLPPVERWNPALSGDMDLIIKRDGTWLHEGGSFKRTALVDLLAKVLKREGDEYFLVTPVEKWRIQVENVPFYVNSVEAIVRNGQTALCFGTSTGDQVVAGPNNPLRVVTDPITQEPSPYLLVRNNLEGFISRGVFYELVEMALNKVATNATELIVESLGTQFSLGEIAQN